MSVTMAGLGGALSRELEVAERLARQAGALVMGLRGPEIDVEMKAGNEPVTEADRNSSQLIMQGLAAAFPDDVHISEENADELRRLDAERVWYVDPIDGTKDFIRGHEGFAVMIGLTVQHRPVLGVVYHPVHDRLFLAAGDEAWFQAPGDPPRKLQVSRVVEPSDLRLVASKSNRTHKIDEVKSANIDRFWTCRSMFMQDRLFLAAGDAAWFQAPGEPLHYDHPDVRRTSGLVASNGLVHDEVIARLGPLFARR